MTRAAASCSRRQTRRSRLHPVSWECIKVARHASPRHLRAVRGGEELRVSDLARAGLGAIAARPHRRFNPLSGEWVLVSPHRTQRPWQGRVERVPDDERPQHDPSCYLCPGNSRAGGYRNPSYTGTFVFDNDYPTLRPDDDDPPNVEVGELLLARPESGICRVVCFSPRHDLTMA